MSLENFTTRYSRHAWHRVCQWGAVLAAVLVLGGCGPGIVGTGDGGLAPDDTAIQFTPANVCDAGFAANGLDCTANGREPVDGTRAVVWADANKTNEGATARAQLLGHAITLNQPCVEGLFEGRWGELADGRQAYVGRYADLRFPAGVPALLMAKPDAADPELAAQVTVETAAGTLLAGPWQLRRVQGAVTFAACVL